MSAANHRSSSLLSSLLLLLLIVAMVELPKTAGYVVDMPIAGADDSVWSPYLARGNGLRRMYIQRREVISQRDIPGQFGNVRFVVDGPDRVFYRRILTPIYATPSIYYQ